MYCPQCNKLLKKVGKFWICPDHGQVRCEEGEPQMSVSKRPQNVFISYGRADALVFVKQLTEDLKRLGGHEAFFDMTNIEKGDLFEVVIESGIRKSSVLLAVMTSHSLREESVCRDEIVFALNEGKKLLPLLKDPSPPLKPSLLLCRRNWIDFTGSYEQGLHALLHYLEGDETVLQKPRLPFVTGVAPIDFSLEIARFSSGFTGRRWFNREIDAWIGKGKERAFVIVAEPGAGKSSIAAWLSQVRPEDVVAVHFCTQQNTRSLDPHEFVASLIGQLQARIEGFAEAVEAKTPDMRRPTAADAFRELVIETSLDITPSGQTKLIIVDSLDESATREGETVLDVLVKHVPDLPSWLRVITTTRPEAPILNRIKKLKVFTLMAQSTKNTEDIREYVQKRLAFERPGTCSAETIRKVETLADGNFLYARLVLDDLETGVLKGEDLGALSSDLVDFYYKSFLRLFPDINDYERDYTPLLRALAAARGPLSFGLLNKICGESAETLNRHILAIRSYLRVYGSGESASYVLFHKSLQDWLTENGAAGVYWLDLKKGHQNLADVLLEDWTENEYALRHLPAHLMAAERWEELEKLLTDLRFIKAKCASEMTYELTEDYSRALDILPEVQDEKKEELKHQERITKYTEDLIAYARGEIKEFDIIPSVRPWTDEEIEKDSERIINKPTPLDRIKAFSQFVNSESHGLVKFGAMPGFCIQQAYNFAGSGPVAEEAKKIIDAEKDTVLFLRSPSQRPPYNPHPALLRTLEGHTSLVFAVSLTPDGKQVVSGSGDNTLRVWDTETGRCLSILKGHTALVSSVSLTPDSQRVVTGSWDNTLRIWDFKTGQCLNIMKGHTDKINSINLTPDGHLIVSGSDDATLRIWDNRTGQCLRTLDNSPKKVMSVCISPDGQRAISGDERSSEIETLKVWDLQTGKCLQTLTGHERIHYVGVPSVSLTPDGKYVVSGSTSIDALRLWDLQTGQCMKTLRGHADDVWSVSLTPDGKRAISGSCDNTLRLWNLKTGQCLKTLEGHAGRVYSVSMTPDGRRAVSGSSDNTIKVWDLGAGQCLKTIKSRKDHRAKISTVNLTPDGRRAVSDSGDKPLLIWDSESGQIQYTLSGHVGSNNEPTVTLTADGKLAVSGGHDTRLMVWNTETGQRLKTLITGNQSTRSAISIWSIGITPDNRLAVTGDSDNSLRVWDLKSGIQMKTLEGHSDCVWSVSFTPDGRSAVSGSWDRTLKVWDLDTGQVLCTLTGHTDKINRVVLSRDGRRVVSASEDRTLKVWDLRSGQCVKTLTGHAERVNDVSLSPDDRRVVSSSWDKTLRVWGLEEVELLGIYQQKNQSLHISAATAFGRIALGASGELIFLQLRNMLIGTPIVTPARLWHFDEANGSGQWEMSITTTCLWCGIRFSVGNTILDTIYAINRDNNIAPEDCPCLRLPKEAWHELGLLSECPHCHKTLKFNPFVVDNSDKY